MLGLGSGEVVVQTQLAKFLSALLRNVGESAQTLALFTHRRDDTVDRLRVGGGQGDYPLRLDEDSADHAGEQAGRDADQKAVRLGQRRFADDPFEQCLGREKGRGADDTADCNGDREVSTVDGVTPDFEVCLLLGRLGRGGRRRCRLRW